MMKVGITGGIGSGKSIVCRIFALLGIPVYDSDSRAKKLMNSDPKLIAGIRGLFGEEAYRDGQLDRKYIASRVFGHPRQLEALNALVHPAVKADFRQWAERQKAPYVIEENAILFESGFYRDTDKTVAVSAPEALRIRRTRLRDGVTEEAVRMRMANQMSEPERLARVDYVLYSDEKQLLIPQVLNLHETLTRLSKEIPCK